jgi:hypothetical protein
MQHATALIPHSFGQRLRAVSLIVTLAVTSACSNDSTGLGSGKNQLAFTTGSSASANATLSVVPVTSGGHTLDLTAVTLTISRAELKWTKADVCPGDDDDENEDDDHSSGTGSTEHCGELKIGPTTVALPLDGNLATLPANAIPAGTFREFELRVSQVELKGTFDGVPFDVTLPVRVKSEIELDSPLVVTSDTPTTITVNVPVNSWLTNADGSLIDPSKILASPALTAQVKSRVAASFRAFEDRDHDGRDDHGGKGDRDGHN